MAPGVCLAVVLLGGRVPKRSRQGSAEEPKAAELAGAAGPAKAAELPRAAEFPRAAGPARAAEPAGAAGAIDPADRSEPPDDASHGGPDMAEALAVVVGLSIAFWPLAFLWLPSVGIDLTALAVRGIVVGACVVAVGGWIFRGLGRPSLPVAAAAVLVLVAGTIALRVFQARDLVVPAWVDGLHHTEIAWLFATAGRIPTTLRPFMPVDRFYYHFGFHATAAAAALLGGGPITASVLWIAQALSAASALTIYPLAVRLTGRREAAVLSAAVPASLYWFPAYFVTWSRFTQLAGLVLLPIAWWLLDRASRRGGGSVVAAAIAAAGIVLTHYRVAVLFGIGAAAIGCGVILRRGSRRLRLGRIGAAAGLAAGLAAPWLAGPLYSGTRALRAAQAQLLTSESAGRAWYAAVEGSNTIPDWMWHTRYNTLVLAVAGVGALAGLALRRRETLGAIAVTGAAFLAANLRVAHLDDTWMLPNFSLAISAYLPAAIGAALLGLAAIRLLTRRGLSASAGGKVVVGLSVLAAGLAVLDRGALAGGRVRPFDVVNPATVIVQPADLAAAAWIAGHTPANAAFLVSAAPWHLGTYRGLDGGYWLPLFTGDRTSMPAALYPYGPIPEVRRVVKIAETVSRGDELTNSEINEVMDEAGADYVYAGPAAKDDAAALHASRLSQDPALREIYSDGGVTIFERRR